MKSLRRKLAASLIEDLITPPATHAWAEASQVLRDAEGPDIMERELVPGFEETLGSEVLWRPATERAEESSEEKNEKRRIRKMLLGLGKFGSTSWEYEAGARRPYRESSPRAERDRTTGTSLAWQSNAPDTDDFSSSPEPALLNQSREKGAYEWGTIETPKYKRAPVSESSAYDDSARAVSSLFDQNEQREQMTDQVPGLNFRGSDMHYANPKYARTMDHALVWQPELWTTSNDEKTEHARLPGKKPVVRDQLVEEGTGNVWQEHDAFQANKGIVDNAPANPGPPV